MLDPVFSSIALLRTSSQVQLHTTPQATFSGQSVYKNGVKYSQLATSETAEAFNKLDGENNDQKQVNLEMNLI